MVGYTPAQQVVIEGLLQMVRELNSRFFKSGHAIGHLYVTHNFSTWVLKEAVAHKKTRQHFAGGRAAFRRFMEDVLSGKTVLVMSDDDPPKWKGKAAVGDRVTISTPQGQLCVGKVVMPSNAPGRYVLNCGGRHGNPMVADEYNIIRVQPRRKEKACQKS